MLGELFREHATARDAVAPAEAATVAHDLGGRVRLAAPNPTGDGGAAHDEQVLARLRRSEAEVEQLTRRLDALSGSFMGGGSAATGVCVVGCPAEVAADGRRAERPIADRPNVHPPH